MLTPRGRVGVCRYVMHGSGGFNGGHNIRFGTELADTIRHFFPGICLNFCLERRFSFQIPEDLKTLSVSSNVIECRFVCLSVCQFG